MSQLVNYDLLAVPQNETAGAGIESAKYVPIMENGNIEGHIRNAVQKYNALIFKWK